MEENPEIGLIGPYTNQAAGPQVLWPPAYKTMAGLPAWSKKWARSHRGSVKSVPWVIGFCVLIPRTVLARVGYLDEAFEAGGFEDYDYCLRVRMAGYEIGIAEDVYVHHFGGRGYVNMDYDGLRAHNREVFWSKWCRAVEDRYSAFAPLQSG